MPVKEMSTCWYGPVCTGTYQRVFYHAYQISVYEIVVHTGMYQYVLVHTYMYWYILTGKSMNLFIPVHTATISKCNYIPVHTSSYQHIPVYTSLYWYVLVHTSIYLDSKKVQTRFEPEIFCILFACSLTPLQEYRHQIPGMYQPNCLYTYTIRSVPVCVPGS